MLSFALSKLVTAVLSPLGTGLLAGTAGILLQAGTTRRRLRALGSGLMLFGLAWLWLWSLPAASQALVQRLEARFPPQRAESLQSADAIVVLGGALAAPVHRNADPDLGSASDRVWHAARLFHAGKAPLLVASGGSDPAHTPVAEAEAMRTLLQDLRVPAAAILLEARSRSTRQNADFTAALLKERGLRRVLVVTSASHMGRAAAEFERAGLVVVAAATDHAQPQQAGLQRWLPDAGALEASGRAFKEIAGRLALRLQS